MTTFTVTVKDQAVLDVLQQLQRRMGNLQPALQAIGDDMVERTKRRFDTSTAPDGSGWKPNSAATLGLFVGGFGKSNFKKDGGLNAKGHKALANKRPLIGESLDLSRQIFAKSNSNQLTVSSSPGALKRTSCFACTPSRRREWMGTLPTC